MSQVTAELSDLLDRFQAAAQPVVDAWDDETEPHDSDASTPALALEAMARLIDVLKRADASGNSVHPGSEETVALDDISRLGGFGFRILTEMADFARQLDLTESAAEIDALHFNLALWVARRGGELDTLETLVNHLAGLANQTMDPGNLAQLCGQYREIIDAVAEGIRQDLENANPGRPWRVLHLNYAIVATRSHREPLMEIAFRSLTDNLPEDAAEFFREGMEQMEALDYPANIRTVMARYYNEWSVIKTRRLH